MVTQPRGPVGKEFRVTTTRMRASKEELFRVILQTEGWPGEPEQVWHSEGVRGSEVAPTSVLNMCDLC